MNTFFLGLLGALLFVAIFGAGLICGWILRRATASRLSAGVSYEDPDGVVTAEQIKEERKRLKAQQDAFHTLQNYSAEMAYGLVEEPTHTGG